MRFSLVFRLTAVLSSFLLLQLTLLASGTLCGMHREQDDRVNVTSPQPSEANTSSVEEAATGMPMGSCNSSGGCGLPWVPARGCSSMASCVIVVSAASAPEASTGATLVDPVPVLAWVAMPLGPAFAPEPPPPRA